MKGWGKGRAANDNGANERAFDEMYSNGAADLRGRYRRQWCGRQHDADGDPQTHRSFPSRRPRPKPLLNSETLERRVRKPRDGGSALPLIGRLPMLEQQRILIGLIVMGLFCWR